MTRSYQQGYVSPPIHTRRGIVFRIRYRVRTGEGKWTHPSETLYGLSSRKAARDVLQQRIREASATPPETSKLTFEEFVDAYWIAYLQRKGIKPSTLLGYVSALKKHILPVLGKLLLKDISPLHIENFMKAKLDEREGQRK